MAATGSRSSKYSFVNRGVQTLEAHVSRRVAFGSSLWTPPVHPLLTLLLFSVLFSGLSRPFFPVHIPSFLPSFLLSCHFLSSRLSTFFYSSPRSIQRQCLQNTKAFLLVLFFLASLSGSSLECLPVPSLVYFLSWSSLCASRDLPQSSRQASPTYPQEEKYEEVQPPPLLRFFPLSLLCRVWESTLLLLPPLARPCLYCRRALTRTSSGEP